MILTITPNPAVDQTIEMDEEVQPDAVQRATDAQFNAGGNGINVSKFLKALDHDTVATGITGGFTGYFVEKNLQRYGVPTDFVDVDGVTRINTTILTPENEYHVNQIGPVGDRETVDELIETIQSHNPSMINIGGSLPPEVNAPEIDRIAGAGEWQSALDVPGELMRELDAHYEFCKPNRDELAGATGIDVDSLDDGARAARELQQMGYRRVIASLGDEGVVMATPEETLYAPPLDVEVVDTIGAGDSMFAAVLWGHEQGWADEKALRAGVAASAHIVGVAGPTVEHLDPTSMMDQVRVWSLR